MHVHIRRYGEHACAKKSAKPVPKKSNRSDWGDSDPFLCYSFTTHRNDFAWKIMEPGS